MKETVSRLSNSTVEEALRTIEKGGLTPFLQVRHAKYINWRRSEGNVLVGRIPYLRSRDLSIYEFRLQPVTNDRINIAVVATSLVYILVPLAFILGLLMFCVAVIFPIILLYAINNRLGNIQADIQQALEAWDKTQIRRA